MRLIPLAYRCDQEGASRLECLQCLSSKAGSSSLICDMNINLVHASVEHIRPSAALLQPSTFPLEF